MNTDIKENTLNSAGNDTGNSKDDISKNEKDSEKNISNINKTENDTEENGKDTDNIYYAKFSKPIEHCGIIYEGLDMSKVRDLTTKEKIDIDRIYERIESVKPKNFISSTMYIVCVAHYVTKLPMEFFYRMRSFEFLKIETAVKIAFFMPI